MTRIKRLMMILGVLVGLTAFPLTLGAVTARECAYGKPTAASYTWDLHSEANALFEDVQTDAQQVTNHAAQLQSFSDDSNMGWQAHADQLNQVRSEVNDMGKKLSRLETIRRVVSPWQQKTIDRIASTVPLMADNTEDAIVYLRAHENDLINPTYRRYADNLYSEGNNLTQSVGDAVEYAKVLGEYHQLRGEIGIGQQPS
jgi:hypothetical protein